MSYDRTDDYLEAFQIAWHEAGLPDLDKIASADQQRYIAGSIESSAEHVGQAFYSPPQSDRIAAISQEFEAKRQGLIRDHDATEAHYKRIVDDLRRTITRLETRIMTLTEQGFSD